MTDPLSRNLRGLHDRVDGLRNYVDNRLRQIEHRIEQFIVEGMNDTQRTDDLEERLRTLEVWRDQQG